VSEHGLDPLAARNRAAPDQGRVRENQQRSRWDGGYAARRSGTKRKASDHGGKPVLKQKLMGYPKNIGDIPKKWLDSSFFFSLGNWFDEEKR
jgi:hypothetical protein